MVSPSTFAPSWRYRSLPTRCPMASPSGAGWQKRAPAGASARGFPHRAALERAPLAAVHHPARTVHPARARGEQEGHHLGDLLGPAEAAAGDLAPHEGGDALGIGLLPPVPAA